MPPQNFAHIADQRELVDWELDFPREKWRQKLTRMLVSHKTPNLLLFASLDKLVWTGEGLRKLNFICFTLFKL